MERMCSTRSVIFAVRGEDDQYKEIEGVQQEEKVRSTRRVTFSVRGEGALCKERVFSSREGV